VLWASYLLTTKRVRQTMDVVEFMAAVVPIAAVALIPVVLIRGGATEMDTRAWGVVLLLTVLTGLGAHGMIVFAQRSLPIATIGVMQIAQPALAVMWAALLLGEAIRPIQMVGMAMVLAGLALFNWSSRRTVAAAD
jgi:drug/metabolite transporter (DMT)-like permease